VLDRTALLTKWPKADDNTIQQKPVCGGAMLANKKVAVVLPAYNAAQTLKQTFDEIPHDTVDDVILTDDASQDATVEMARSLGIATIRHDRNRGYGSNQKTCYTRRWPEVPISL
jgi:cellulose synthase/poly-beta-1,6-N-acetylglucosamine synthase-like glycosyltransferase